MTGKPLRKRCFCRSTTTLVAMAVASAVPALGLAGCSTTDPPGRAAAVAPAVPTPLATSVQTADGTWATIPMGRLGEPLNTFWQLLFEPAGTAAWSNQVEATATATNGGLVLTSVGRQLLVGVRPSVDLTFTPLVSTADAARSWSEGLITARLAARPAALAAGPGGHAVALVDGAGGARVLSSAGDISKWRTVTTETALAATGPGRRCGLGALPAVGYLAGQALLGGSCARPGVVGIWARRAGEWRLTGPGLPASLGRDEVEVLSLGQAKTGAYGLLAVVGGHVTDIVAAWSGPGGRWTTSAPLALTGGEQVASFGPTDGAGLFVLLRAPSGRAALMMADGPGAAWRGAPSPPAGTATVAFGAGAGSPAYALVAAGTKLTIWSLRPRASTWAPGQVMHVHIQYGSSS